VTLNSSNGRSLCVAEVYRYRWRYYARSPARARGLVQLMVGRLTCVALAAVVLVACTSTPPDVRSGRVVLSQYNGWTIRVTPSFLDRWRARVQVWPPDVNPETHGGIRLHFTDSAADEPAVVQSAIAAARRYIDGSRRQPE